MSLQSLPLSPDSQIREGSLEFTFHPVNPGQRQQLNRRSSEEAQGRDLETGEAAGVAAARTRELERGGDGVGHGALLGPRLAPVQRVIESTFKVGATQMAVKQFENERT